MAKRSKSKKQSWRDRIETSGIEIVMNPVTGELEHQQQAKQGATGKTGAAPAKKAPATDSKTDKKGDTSWEDRYRHLQSFATRQRQENIELNARLLRLEKGGSSKKSAAEPTKLGGTFTLPSDLESVFTSPESLKNFVVGVLQTQLSTIGEYVDARLQPFTEVRDAFETHKEFTAVTKAHPDFVHWKDEMEAVLAKEGPDAEYTFEEL